VLVNGLAMKLLIEEEVGDGIMSAKRLRHDHRPPGGPQGRPRQARHAGKFLPFKYYGATGNAQAYGYKEE
jgi:cyanate lyase